MGITSVKFNDGRQDHKNIFFKIENFPDFLKMSNKELELEEHGVIFNAGNCTLNDGSQIPAIWKFSFEQTTNEHGQNSFVGVLVLHRPTNKSDVKSSINVQWTVSLSAGNYGLSCVEQCNQFAGTSGLLRVKQIFQRELENLESETRISVLEVKILVKVSVNDWNWKPILRNPSPTSTKQLRGQMTLDFVRMLESGDESDVEIKVPSELGGEVDESSYTKAVHKFILMSRSSVFAQMFAKDSTMTEAQTGKVVIKDLSPKGLDVFLHYLYTGEVLQDWGQVGPEILNAAEKYDCGQLKQFCGSHILDVVSTRNAVELYKSVKLHGLVAAAERVMDFILMNTKSVIDQIVEDSK